MSDDDEVVPLDSAVVRIGAEIARKEAGEYFQCYLDFKFNPGIFSRVPYFLCCRAIECALKARHFEIKSQEEVENYGHDLKKLYAELPIDDINLSLEERRLLKRFSQVYNTKGYEYYKNLPYHAAIGFAPLGDLNALAELARKITGYTPPAAAPPAA